MSGSIGRSAGALATEAMQSLLLSQVLHSRHCCQRSEGGVLDLHIGDFCDVLNEDFLLEVSQDCKQIHLTIRQAHDLDGDLCAWLSKHIGPKLVRLSVLDSGNLNWNHQIKRVLENAKSVDEIYLCNNKWVDDYVVEQLSVKFAKSLRVLDLENTQISDHALHHLSRRCANLRNMSLNCCPRISDNGILEMARKMHLSHVSIRHNMHITDESIEKLLSSSNQLHTLRLTNCPKLTDRSVESMYEAVVAWGKRRNTKTLSLKVLDLQDIPNLTYQSLVFLSTAVPNVEVLDLRNCSSIDLEKGLGELERMKCLKQLFLGPSDVPLKNENFLQSLLFHVSNLTVLHLVGLTSLADDDVAEILNGTLLLDEVHLEDIQVGTHSIEALCSNVPNLSSFTLIGSNAVNDADLRCVSSIMLYLKQLTVKFCSSLTDAAFSRCVSLRKLTKVDLSHCSPHLSGACLGNFTLCPIEHLTLDGFPISMSAHLPKLSAKTCSTLRYFSAQECEYMDEKSIMFMLTYFWNCATIDLTNSDKGAMSFASLHTLWHPHPFVSFVDDINFVGFRESSSMRPVHARFGYIREQCKKHHMAQKIQKLRRRYLVKCQEIAELERLMILAYRQECSIKIQSVFRKCLAQLRFFPKLQAGRLLVRAARRFLVFRMHRKMVIAKNHYKCTIKKKLLAFLQKYALHSRIDLMSTTERLYPRLALRIRRRAFLTIKEKEELQRAERMYQKSLVLWEGHLLRRVIAKWKLLKGETRSRREALTKMFIIAADFDTYNSHKQLARLRMAENFKLYRTLVIAWVSLNDDAIRARKAELLMPQASAHFEKTFFHRVVGHVFHRILYFIETVRIKHVSRKKGDKGRRRYLLFNGMRYTYNECCRMVRIKRNRIACLKQYVLYNTRLAVTERLPINVFFERHLKKQAVMVREHWNDFKVKYYMKSIIFNCQRMKKWREANWVAENKRNFDYWRRYLRAWREVHAFAKVSEAHYYRNYLLAKCKKILAALAQEVAEGKAYRAKVSDAFDAAFDKKKEEEGEEEEEEEDDPDSEEAKARAGMTKKEREQDDIRRAEEKQRAAEEKKRLAFAAMIRGVVLFQAIGRGVIARALFNTRKVEVFFATQVLQNFGRKGLAIRLYRRLFRERTLLLRVAEEKELDKMRTEDADRKFFNFASAATLNIQRVFRGYRGRIQAAIDAYIISRAKGVNYYQNIKALRENVDAARRALELKERKRASSSTLIQKRVRGMQARKRFVKIKAQANMNRLVIRVQQEYRRRLGEMQLMAIRRDKIVQLRFQAARKQRGFILRLFGFSKRKAQAVFAVALEGLGIDPITYNYRFRELLQETYNDFWDLISIARREFSILKEVPPNDALKVNQARRKYLHTMGYSLKRNDPVKIIELGHPFLGYTGIVVRIDTSLPGIPLYEVKLDHFPRQTFVNMTSDALVSYMNPQPLVKIPIRSKLEDFHQPFLIFGVNEGDPMFTRKNVKAAWTIQRAFRMYRSRKIVARKRYELWVRSSDRQRSFFHHLADTNTLTAQANNILTFLDVRPTKPVFFDEVRHSTLSQRYDNSMKQKDENKLLAQEFEQKYRERLLYLQKSAIIRGKEYFGLGFERLTRMRKMAMFLRRLFGYNVNGTTAIKDLSGSAGAKFLSKNQSMVTGLAQYDFKQFDSSPHVRYYRSYIYQGQWSGIPMFTPLRPHGEGVLVFFDGWGFAREDKVLYLEIIACRYLNAADMDTSDPYCDIFCNGTNLQTSVKWFNLNPVYHEKFEIDVTNISASLNIVVKDKDFLGSDDFLGQIVLPLIDYVDGKERRQTFLLKGEDLDADEGDFDRGEIEVRIQWSDRKFDDDLVREEIQRGKAIIIQSWARRLAAAKVKKGLINARSALLEMVRIKAIKITNTWRIRIARKKLKKLKRRQTACIKIQKRARIRQAKKKVKYLMTRKYAAIKIQALMRKCLAKAFVKRMKKNAKADLDKHATMIIKHARRAVVRMRIAKAKEEERELAAIAAAEVGDDDNDFEEEEVAKPPVSSWIGTFGRDAEYGLKRNRRMTETYFRRLLKMTMVRLVTSKYGIVYVEQYPARKSDEDALAEKKGGSGLTKRDEFVSVFFPLFRQTGTHRTEADELFRKFPHVATMHIPSSIELRASVDFNVTTIQCAARQKIARNKKAKVLRIHAAFAKLQRIFRRRNEKQNKAAFFITALFRLIYAKKITQLRRREKKSSILIQCCYRSFQARSKAFDLICVRDINVLKFSSAVPFHGPAKALEFKMETFWMADSKDFAEIRVEMKRKECINQIWIQTSTHSTSPKFVTISTVLDKTKKKFHVLVNKFELLFLKGARWHKFAIPETIAKYYKLSFYENYGDDSNIAVRQIRFVKTKESSVSIIEQPLQNIMDRGPTVGKRGKITLRCTAAGWPHPFYQWYKNGRLIPGATEQTLELSLKCKLDNRKRTFRCLKCKMVSKAVPNNAYHVVCGNCSALFAYKEIQEYDNLVKSLQDDEAVLNKELKKLSDNKFQLESLNDAKYAPLLDDIKVRTAEAEVKLQNLREARYSAKSDLENTNRFSDEGIYCCWVRNIRGGSIAILRKSVRAVVVVEHSVPYFVKVKPFYLPRPQKIRKRWTVYHSIMGTFKKGRVEGLIVIRYSDGAFYEGPYISEEWLDATGRVLPTGRAKNHYGVYRTPDGRTFEGKMVDNHFDPNNLQSFYRLTLANGEVYEGVFCDENYHGTGMYVFKDGSVYEGQWHRGTRFGHGHHRSAEGWTYEGGYDNNRRHGDGSISFPDGSFYMGQWYYDKRQGKGVYISHLRDVYKGDVVDGMLHGYGELLYADGSRHTGEFKNGKRNGRGIFCDRDGSQYYGHFVDDLRHGEHIIKAIIPIEEKGQDNYEVRVGVYNMGNFVKWKLKYSNPLATRQFVDLFKDNRAMFDSVYSMMLAKNLPAVPEGVDETNEDVKDILLRLRDEAGSLVGKGALIAAQAQLQALLEPIKVKREERDALKKQIDVIGLQLITLDKDASDLMRKFSALITVVEKEAARVEQFWIDDATESRAKFQLVCEKLGKVTAKEFFTFRNHRLPPPFVKKIMDAICYLMGIPDEWKRQQMLVADSTVNGREGDDLGLRFEFDCKLVFMMKEYRVYDYVRISENRDKLNKILADPRFRRDSYYIESCGVAAPPLVDWVKANVNYIKRAMFIYSALDAMEEKKTTAYRFKAQSTKKTEEYETQSVNLVVLKKKLVQAELELGDLQEALGRANELLDFITQNDLMQAKVKAMDYYKELEVKIEQKRDFFAVETCMQFVVEAVESRVDYERKAKIRDALSKGEVYEEPVVTKPLITDWLMGEVRSLQSKILEGGETLGYSYPEDEPNAISWESTSECIERVVSLTIGRMNERFNDLATSTRWRTQKGKLLDARFLYVFAWKMWEGEAVEAKELKSVAAWEEVFTTPEEAAKAAIEAKVNERMSEVAKDQGRIWAKRHKMEVEVAERLLSDAFAYQFAEETAMVALNLIDDLAYPAVEKAKVVSWIRLHPEEINAAKDEINMAKGEEFAKVYQDSAGDIAFKIFNGIATEEELGWTEHAEHWRSFHAEEYLKASDENIVSMGGEFAEAFATNTADEAARVIVSDALSKVITDPEVQASYVQEREVFLNATCWGVRNQGLLRAATSKLKAAHAATASKMWAELQAQTDNFRKGSFLLTPPEMRANPDLDRFAGFRTRLENKFAFLYGYLVNTQIELFSEMETFADRDPFGRIFHNVRPTIRDKTIRKVQDDFLSHKKQTELSVASTMAKISQWNSFFGVKEIAEEGSVVELPTAEVV